jgi:hypothetical protein
MSSVSQKGLAHARYAGSSQDPLRRTPAGGFPGRGGQENIFPRSTRRNLLKRLDSRKEREVFGRKKGAVWKGLGAGIASDRFRNRAD